MGFVIASISGSVMGNHAVLSYQDLVAWQEARSLARRVYEVSTLFPVEERFGLVAKIRRSAVSVPSNIAEGYGRGSRSDCSRFLRIARGSLFELETQLILAHDLGYISADARVEVQKQIDQVARPLSGLIRSVENTYPSRAP